MEHGTEKITDEIFDNLLYLSRLSVKEKERSVMMEHVAQMAAYFDVLQEFYDENVAVDLLAPHTEKELAVQADRESVDQSALRRMSDEYMDGYFRVPKVLDNE